MRRSASISGRLTVDRKQFTSELNAAKTEVGRFSGMMKGLSGPGGGRGGAIGGWTELHSKIQLAVGGFNAARTAAGSLFKNDLQVESAIRSLAAVNQGTETVKQQMEALSELGKKPGIGFEEAIQASAALQSVGIESGKSRAMLEQFSNALASVGGTKDDLEGVALSLRQIMGTGVVDAQNIKEISRRIPQFGPIAEGADKSDPRKWLDEVTTGLSQLARVTPGAQESIDNFTDSWKKFLATKSGGGVSAVASSWLDAASSVISGEKGVFEAFSGAGAGLASSETDPVKKFEPSRKEMERRAKSRADLETQRAERREESAREALHHAAQEQALELKLAEARAAKDEKSIASAEDTLDVFREAAKLAEELAISEERAANFIREQNALRRQSEQRIKAAGEKSPLAKGHRSQTTEEFRRDHVTGRDDSQYYGLDDFRMRIGSALTPRHKGGIENNPAGPLNDFRPFHTNTPRTDANREAARHRAAMESSNSRNSATGPAPGSSGLNQILTAIRDVAKFIKDLKAPADRLKSSNSP